MKCMAHGWVLQSRTVRVKANHDDFAIQEFFTSSQPSYTIQVYIDNNQLSDICLF
jgi:hypothetical protein